MYSQDVLEQIKGQINIVDVVSRYVTLKKVGKNYKGLCPFHAEKTPSFFVNPELNIFKCFGCGIGGDIFKFVQEIEKINFSRAVEKLAKQAGIELPRSKEASLQYKKRKKILNILDVYSRFFHKVLLSKAGKNALTYIQNRGLSMQEIRKYRLGYAPSDATVLLKFAKLMKFSNQDLIDAGLITEQNTPRFKYRLMFPLFDVSGNVIGFSGRTLSNSSNVPKYLNTPETIVFKKRYFLFGLYWAKQFIVKDDFVILTEGQMDVLSSFRAGVNNIVAPLGTALTETQLIMLKRLTNKIAFAFDNDLAGQKALMRSVILALKQGFVPYIIDLSSVNNDLHNFGSHSSNLTELEIKDIDELIKIDANLWQKLAKKPIEFFEFQIQKIKNQQISNYVELEQNIDSLLEILSYADNLRQEVVLKELANKLELSLDTLKQRFDHIKEKLNTNSWSADILTYNTSYRRNVGNSDNNAYPDELLNNESVSEIPGVRLVSIRDNLEKYITSVIVHYPVITLIKDFFVDMQDLFFDPVYKAIIELSKKAVLSFLQKQEQVVLRQAQKSLVDFYSLFLEKQGTQFYSEYMLNYLKQTNFYNIFIELGALEPPFSVLDKKSLKDFLFTWKRYKYISYKLDIKKILEQLDELEKKDGTKNKILIKKLNKKLKKLTIKLQELSN